MATRNRHDDGLIPQAVFKFDHIDNHVKLHLKKVYSSLAIGMLCATVGAYVHVFTNLWSAGFLTSIFSIGLLIYLGSTRHSKETETKRLGIFSAFCLLSGVSLGPLLEFVVAVNPSIIVTALLGASVIFISFSLASLLNRDRKFLYLGGFLASALFYMLCLGFLNIFFGSELLFDIQLYGGLLVFCAFVLYDTQLIIEKKRMGDDDYIWHSVDLFIDFIQIFRKLMIILAKKEDKKKK